MERAMISMLIAAIIPIIPHHPSWSIGLTATSVSRLRIINRGMAIGNPIMAINAAFCRALAAMADKKVNKSDKEKAPRQAIPTNILK